MKFGKLGGNFEKTFKIVMVYWIEMEKTKKRESCWTSIFKVYWSTITHLMHDDGALLEGQILS